eukprot:COSAG04_NODE_780_length_10315_cov_3.685033_6_plen_215_part_00
MGEEVRVVGAAAPGAVSKGGGGGGAAIAGPARGGAKRQPPLPRKSCGAPGCASWTATPVAQNDAPIERPRAAHGIWHLALAQNDAPIERPRAAHGICFEVARWVHRFVQLVRVASASSGSAGAAERGVVLRLKGERDDGFVARAGLMLGGDLSSHPPPPARAAERRAPLPRAAAALLFGSVLPAAPALPAAFRAPREAHISGARGFFAAAEMVH